MTIESENLCRYLNLLFFLCVRFDNENNLICVLNGLSYLNLAQGHSRIGLFKVFYDAKKVCVRYDLIFDA